MTSTTSNVDSYLNNKGSGNKWQTQTTFTLSASDISALATTNYTFWMAAWNGTISKVTITVPGGNTGGGDGSGSGDDSQEQITPDYTYQNDPEGDGVLNPTADKPAFGCYVHYANYPQLTNLPTMYLTTADGETLDYTNKTETYYQATIVIVDRYGTMKQRNEATTFRGRGNATWNNGTAKKPWRLKFPTKTSLLAEYSLTKNKEVENYADAKSWTLLSNPFDKSMIRNAVSNELGKLVGLPFCPAYKFVDLVLNGEYYGTYQISDHMEVAQKRVYVGSKNDWFIELCAAQYGEDPQFSTNGYHFNIKNPDDDAAIAAAMQEYMSNVITAVNAKSGLAQYVDLATLADYIMGMDVTANFDGVKGNGYCYKGLLETDKLMWGPLWDLDLGYGNVGGWASASNVDVKHFWEIQDGYNSSFFKNIYESVEFQKVFYPRWKAVYEAGLLTSLNAKVDQIYNTVKQSALLNYTEGGHYTNQYSYEKWTMSTSNMGLTYSDKDTEKAYKSACDYIKTFNSSHIEWLNTQYKADFKTITGLDPDAACSHTYLTRAYKVQTDGTYRRACDKCGVAEEDGTTYYLFTIYPESSETQTLYATSWQPSSERPNAIATVEVSQALAESIPGYNIVSSKKNADGNLTCSDLRLTDGHPFFSANKFVAASATYSRSITNRWGTLCLPFKTQAASNEYASFFHLDNFLAGSNGGSPSLVFKPVEPETDGNCSAYMPVVFKASEKAMTEGKLMISWSNITVKKTASADMTTPNATSGWTLQGTMTATTAQATTEQPVYYISGNQFWYAQKQTGITPFHAFYTVGTPSESAAPAACRIILTDETTAIDEIQSDEEQLFPTATQLFDLQGRPVSGYVTPGLYLSNGKKILLR